MALTIVTGAEAQAKPGAVANTVLTFAELHGSECAVLNVCADSDLEFGHVEWKFYDAAYGIINALCPSSGHSTPMQHAVGTKIDVAVEDKDKLVDVFTEEDLLEKWQTLFDFLFQFEDINGFNYMVRIKAVLKFDSVGPPENNLAAAKRAFSRLVRKEFFEKLREDGVDVPDVIQAGGVEVPFDQDLARDLRGAGWEPQLGDESFMGSAWYYRVLSIELPTE